MYHKAYNIILNSKESRKHQALISNIEHCITSNINPSGPYWIIITHDDKLRICSIFQETIVKTPKAFIWCWSCCWQTSFWIGSNYTDGSAQQQQQQQQQHPRAAQLPRRNLLPRNRSHDRPAHQTLNHDRRVNQLLDRNAHQELQRRRCPGLRLCWVVAPAPIVELLGAAGSFLDGGANAPSQYLALPLMELDFIRRDTWALQRHFKKKRDYSWRNWMVWGLMWLISRMQRFMCGRIWVICLSRWMILCCFLMSF